MAQNNPLNRYEFAAPYDPRIVGEYIARAAQARGIDPEVALRVWQSEGKGGYTGDQGSSFGPFQLHYGNVAAGGNRVGGLGDVFTQKTGFDARDPSTWVHQVDFALDQAKQGGWGPWHGWKGSKWAGISRDHSQDQPLYETGRFVPQAEPIRYAGMQEPVGGQMFSPEPLAYAETPARPFFPPMNAAERQQQAAAQQPITMEHFFEGGALPQTTSQAVQQTAPATQADFTMEDLFEGKPLPTPATTTGAQAQPYVSQEQGQVVSAPGGEWGFGRELARGAVSGLTGGLGDLTRAGATVRAGYEYLTGQAPEGFGNRFRGLVRQQEAARQAYEQENPMESVIATGIGGTLGSVAPLGIAAKGLGAGVKAAQVAAPRLVPALESVAQFAGGKGSAFAGIPSKAAEGALYGAGEAALTQKLVPEEERGLKSIGYGALGGGLVGGAMAPLVGSLGKSFSSFIPAERKALATAAKDKFGLDVHVAQVAEDPNVRKLYEEIVPHSKQTDQINKWNDKLAEFVGMKGESFSGANVSRKMEKTGQDIGAALKGNTARLDAKFRNTYQNYVDNLWNGASRLSFDDPLRDSLARFHQNLLKDLGPNNIKMSGELVQNYIKRGGIIDRRFPFNAQDPLNRQIAHDMKEMFLGAFERSNKHLGKEYREARELYKNLAAIKDIVGEGTVGKIDPRSLLGMAESRKLKGDILELAQIGEYLPKMSESGASATGGKLLDKRALFEAVPGLAGMAASYANVPYGMALTGLAGAQMLKRQMQSHLMGSNVLNQAALRNTRLYQALPYAGNVLYGMGGSFGAGAGGMESER